MMMTAKTQPRAFGDAWPVANSGVLVISALALLMLSSFTGCQTPARQTGMISTLEEPGLSDRQLRIELYDLLDLASRLSSSVRDVDKLAEPQNVSVGECHVRDEALLRHERPAGLPGS